jgi:colanic acid biosynthesis glycosyl transferase WcaI
MHILMLTQVYPKDPAAVGQYFEDVAITLAKAGHAITVYTADRDYDNPEIRYDCASRHPAVRVVRLPFSSFGKQTILHRLLGQISFLTQVFFRLLICSRPDAVVLTTIPATTGAFFLIAQFFRRFDYLYWVMDINPDQAVALGAISPTSVFARALRWVNRRLTIGARQVVCLDEEMKHRIDGGERVQVVPPWPLANDLGQVERAANPFVKEYGLEDKFVFMYSGNHSLVHPLDTLLEGIRHSELSANTRFAFIGGGRGKEKVEVLADEREHVLSLPYQPLDQIKFSLSAADIQIVSMGESMRGIVHPCKLYTALAVGRPILFLGEPDSVLGKVVSSHAVGWCVPHGATDEMAKILQEIRQKDPQELAEIGERARSLVESDFSRKKLSEEFCDIVEKVPSS